MKLIETTARFANNPDYVRYESLAIKLVAAVAVGDEETADLLRDEMDEPADRLHSSEILRLNGLAGDLYSLYDQELLEPLHGTPQEYAAALKAADQGKDAVSILKLIRKEQDRFGKAQVAFLRFRMYWELGHVNPAMLFLDLAVRSDPAHAEYGWLYLGCLFELRRFDEIERVASEIINDTSATPELKIQAATSLHVVARFLGADSASDLHQVALNAVLDGLRNLQGVGGLPFNVRADGYVTLSSIYSVLGRSDEAIDATNSAIRLDPNENEAYGMRGLLLRKTNREQSKQDLVKAVDLNTQSPTVYITLCSLALQDGDLQKCLEYVEKLRPIAKEPHEMAQCLEYSAIAHLMAFGPSDFVREGLELAVSLDPLNFALADNLAKYRELERTVVTFTPNAYENQFDVDFTKDTFQPPLRMAV